MILAVLLNKYNVWCRCVEKKKEQRNVLMPRLEREVIQNSQKNKNSALKKTETTFQKLNRTEETKLAAFCV